MDRYESKLIMSRKQNELLRGYLHEVMGPIDLDNVEITLVVILERRDKEICIVRFIFGCMS